jgi:hypothetical protein
VAETAFSSASAADKAIALQAEELEKATAGGNTGGNTVAAPAPEAAPAAGDAAAPAAASAGAQAAGAGKRRLLQEEEEGYEEPMLQHAINGEQPACAPSPSRPAPTALPTPPHPSPGSRVSPDSSSPYCTLFALPARQTALAHPALLPSALTDAILFPSA